MSDDDVDDDDDDAPDCPGLPLPTEARPGSMQKIDVLAGRVQARLALFHPADNPTALSPGEVLAEILSTSQWRRRDRSKG